MTPDERERAAPTIAETEHLIHKIGLCDSMAAKLILMGHFAARCGEAARREERQRWTGVLQFLKDTLADTVWLDKHAAGRRTEDDELVWDKLTGMRARLKARIEALSELEKER